MQKIKIFSGLKADLNSIENSINNWIDRKSPIIQQISTAESDLNYTITIFYVITKN